VHFEGDRFEMEEAPVPRVTVHVRGPNFGKMECALGVYATLMYAGAGQVTRSRYFTKAKIEAYRKKNRGNTVSSASAWVTATEEMWMAKAILHTTKDLPQNPRLAQLQRLIERQEGPMGLDPQNELPTGAAALPAGDPPAEAEEVPAEEQEAPVGMSLGVAESLPVRMSGGVTRMLGELRNRGLDSVREWARKKLDGDPENPSLRKIAEGATVILEARAAGTAKEPAKQEGN
jgi:hypothetical protein